jgi:hypothetical protein
MKSLKIKKIERLYGVDFGCKNDMKLSKYLKKAGFPSLAKALRLVETKIK